MSPLSDLRPDSSNKVRGKLYVFILTRMSQTLDKETETAAQQGMHPIIDCDFSSSENNIDVWL